MGRAANGHALGRLWARPVGQHRKAGAGSRSRNINTSRHKIASDSSFFCLGRPVWSVAFSCPLLCALPPWVVRGATGRSISTTQPVVHPNNRRNGTCSRSPNTWRSCGRQDTVTGRKVVSANNLTYIDASKTALVAKQFKSHTSSSGETTPTRRRRP